MTHISIWLCIAISLIFTISAVAQPSIRDDRPLRLGTVTLNSTSVPRYGLIEFSIDLQGTFDNAFDPDQIEVNGQIAAPDGKILAVPAFFFQDYTRKLDGSSEVLTPRSEPGWKIRFSPTQVGHYILTVTARDRTGRQAKSKPVKFECAQSDDPGFVRRSKSDNRYFAFDNGKPYIPIGANVCWAGSRGTFDYDDWLPRYDEAGCNYFRVWLGPGWNTFAMEHTGNPEQFGLGKFDQEKAWKLDYVLDLARKHNQYVMLCLDSYNELRKKAEGGYPFWEETPHNAANGGPLQEPREFWTNPTMLRLYRNRLRYMVARYGWSTHVMSWEFWNEVDIISSTAYLPNDVARWHAGMSDYLRGIDPWKHLQTTSFAGSSGKPEVDRLPQMDYTQTHNYGSPDTAAALVGFLKQHEAYDKPFYIGEFGTDAGGPDGKVDPDGIALHSGLWSTICSGSAGPAMLWWWDNFIHPRNMYYHFAAISSYIKGVDFPHESFKRIDDASFAFRNPQVDIPYRDVILSGPASWNPCPANRPTKVDVSKDGTVNPCGKVAGILHGIVNHKDLHNPLTFEMNLPHPTRLNINVTGVSGYGGAHLIADLDGKRVLDKDMPDVNPQGKHDTLNHYDGVYAVDIPAGTHVVAVGNIGQDWMLVNYILERAERKQSPDLRLFGLRGKIVSLLWIQNSQYTWHRVHTLKHLPDPQPASVLTIPSWPAGKYRVHFWDTYAGSETSSREITVGTEGLRIELPEIQKDTALKIEANSM